MVQNVIEKKVYIGSSRHVKSRLSDHKRFLRGNYNVKHPSLQESWNRCGEKAFAFLILEEFDPSISEQNLLQEELKWILHYRSHEDEYGFNKKDPTSRKTIGKCKVATRIPVENKVYSINQETGELKEYFNPVVVAEELNLKLKTLYECLGYWNFPEENRAGRNKSSKGYLFCYVDRYDPDFDYKGYKPPYKPRPKKEKVLKQPKVTYYSLPGNAKPVQLSHSKTGEELYFSSVKECVRVMSMVESKVRHVLRVDYKQRSHHSYWIKFVSMEEYLENRSLDDIFYEGKLPKKLSE